MKILLALLLTATCTAAEASDDIWELDKKEFQQYAAALDSKLVQEMLAEPIERDLARAEMARIALSIMRQGEQARLLKDYMARDVVAELLDLPHRKAATVGEAISQQRAEPTHADAAQWRQALAAARNKGLLSDDGRTLTDRRLTVSQTGLFFRGDLESTPRQLAHKRLFRSTCYELGKCGYATHFLQAKSTRSAIEGFWRLFHAMAVLVGGAIVPWFVIRVCSWLPYSFGAYGSRLQRPLWVGLLAAPLFSLLVYGLLAIVSGAGLTLLLYVLAIGMWGLYPLLLSYAEAIMLLMPVVLLLGRYERLSFRRVVLTATALGIVLPPAWAYLAFGDWEHLRRGSAFLIGVYVLVMSVVFCLITRPNNETGDEVGVWRAGTPLKARIAWFVPLIGVHAALLACYLYMRGSDDPSGILSASLLPWQLLAWVPNADAMSDLLQVIWSGIVWLTAYWLLAGVMLRVTSSSVDAVQGEAATP